MTPDLQDTLRRAKDWVEKEYAGFTMVRDLVAHVTALQQQVNEKEAARREAQGRFLTQRQRCDDIEIEVARLRDERDSLLNALQSHSANWSHIGDEAKKVGIGYDKGANEYEQALWAIRNLHAAESRATALEAYVQHKDDCSKRALSADIVHSANPLGRALGHHITGDSKGYFVSWRDCTCGLSRLTSAGQAG